MSELNCTHPLASAAGNVSASDIFSLLLEEERHEFLLKIPALLMMIVYVCLGIPGNLLVIVVYYFRFRESTTKTFVMSLSAFDLLSCVLGIPFEMVDLRYDLTLDVPGVCKTLRFIITFCACGSTLILLSVAVDRFRRICQPFNRQMSIRQSKIVLGCMTSLSFLIASPALILYGRKTKVYRGVTLVDCTIDDEWSKTGFANGYQFVLGLLWISSILVLCVMYGVILCKIRKQEIRRLNLTSNSMMSVNVSKFYITSASNDAPPSSHCNRKISAGNCEKDLETSTSTKARAQIRYNTERSNSNLEEIKVSEEGKQGNGLRQTNSLNRLFSRDVNPIYEEEDEAYKTLNAGDNVEENEDDDDDLTSSPVDDFGSEQVVNGSDKISLVTSEIQEESYSKPPPKHVSQCDSPVKRYMKKCNNDSSKRLSRSVPCLHEMSITQEDSSYELEEPADAEPVNNTKLKRSNSLPMPSDKQGKRVLFISENGESVGMETDEINSNMDYLSNNLNSHDFYLCEENKDTPKTVPKSRECSEATTRESYGNDCDNYQKLEVSRKRCESDERSLSQITSKSDQTNGSILTLNDSRVIQARRRKISAYSIARQASFTSTSPSIERSYKVNGNYSQHSAVGRLHKNSVTSYTKQPSIASTGTRELKTSKIAVMMFYVTMGHVLSYLPHLAIQFHRVLGPRSIATLLCNTVYFAFHHLLLRSIYLNNAINPIIYSYNNGQFRNYCAQVLKKPFAFCRRKTTSAYTMDSGHSLTLD